MTVKDKCADMPNMVFYRQSGCGTKYYTNTDTNETHCECGVEADFPHKCEQEYDTHKLNQDSVRSQRVTNNGFDIDKMDIVGLRGVIKVLVRLSNLESDRVTILQDRVLQLELKGVNK